MTISATAAALVIPASPGGHWQNGCISGGDEKIPAIQNRLAAFTGKSTGAGTTTEYFSVNVAQVNLPDPTPVEGRGGGRYATVPFYIRLDPMYFEIISPSDLDGDIAPDSNGLFNFEVIGELQGYDGSGGDFDKAAVKKTTITLSGLLVNNPTDSLDNEATEMNDTLRFRCVKYKRQKGGASSARWDIDLTTDPPKVQQYGKDILFKS